MGTGVRAQAAAEACSDAKASLPVDYLGDNVDLQAIFNDLFDGSDGMDIDAFCNEVIEDEYSSSSGGPASVSSATEDSHDGLDRSRSASFASQVSYPTSEEVIEETVVIEQQLPSTLSSPSHQVPSPHETDHDYPLSPEFAAAMPCDDPMLFSAADKLSEFADPEPWQFADASMGAAPFASSPFDGTQFSTDLLLDDDFHLDAPLC